MGTSLKPRAWKPLWGPCPWAKRNPFSGILHRAVRRNWRRTCLQGRRIDFNHKPFEIWILSLAHFGSPLLKHWLPSQGHLNRWFVLPKYYWVLRVFLPKKPLFSMSPLTCADWITGLTDNWGIAWLASPSFPFLFWQRDPWGKLAISGYQQLPASSVDSDASLLRDRPSSLHPLILSLGIRNGILEAPLTALLD